MGNFKVEDLRQYDGPDKIVSSQELDLILRQTARDVPVLKSRIPSLDAATGGFEPGELIVISGPTKQGKTLLGQTLTSNFSSQQTFSTWFSFEVPARQFLSQFPNLPTFYLPQKLKVHLMSWVEERMMEAFVKHHCRVIFIDHLHFLFDMARTKNPSLEIGTIIRRLKTIAVENDFIIFLLCHTRKGRADKDFSFEDLRDSSFVAQESDSVFLIVRTPKAGESAAQLRVEFHRRTGCLEKVINLRKINGLLVEEA